MEYGNRSGQYPGPSRIIRQFDPKIPIPIDRRKARTIVEDLCAWEVVVNDEHAILGAIDLKMKYQLSFWDSLILEATRRSGATTLYSEDLSDWQQVEGMTIVNPFEA